MPNSEAELFRDRLKRALVAAGYSACGPTELARQFNTRFTGRPVSVHAARKWLLGDALPTQDKIRVLAEWLAVPADWLRFGGRGSRETEVVANESLDPIYVKLAMDLRRLDGPHRKLVLEFVRMALRLKDESE